MRFLVNKFTKSFFYLLLLVLISLGGAKSVFAQNNYYHLRDSLSSQAEISILTASPSGKAVYTVYGHAGLRVLDNSSGRDSEGIDITFNYGIFDFTDDFFIRFVSGQTDYLVVPIFTSEYIKEYLSRGSQITEIKLNLSPEAKQYLWSYLIHNIEPENRVYRYNFFYDNCSIRLLNVIKTAITNSNTKDKQLKLILDSSKLDEDLAPSTWRKEINSLEEGNPWLLLGTDLALGKQTDETISLEERCFLPQYLPIILPNYQQVYIDSLGTEHRESLVASVSTIGQRTVMEDSDVDFWEYLMLPSTITRLLLLLVLYKVVVFYRNKKAISKAWDIIIFQVTGLGGLLLFYISFFSEHPHVFPNYNLWVLNPLNLLIALPFLAIKGLNNWAYHYHFANFVSQIVFLLVAQILPQKFNGVVWYLSLTLLLLSFARIIEYRRLKGNKA